MLRRRRNAKQIESHVMRLKVHEIIARHLSTSLFDCFEMDPSRSAHENCAKTALHVEDSHGAFGNESLEEGIHKLVALSRSDLQIALQGVEAEIVACLWQENEQMRQLQKAKEQRYGLTSGKFVTAVAGKFGDLTTFKGGLGGHIGLPDANIMHAIEREHNTSADSSDTFISGNHGLATTPRQEFEFVVCPQRGKEYAGLRAHGGYAGRRPVQLEALLLAAGCNRPLPHTEKQTEDEAARTYVEEVLRGEYGVHVSLIALTAAGASLQPRTSPHSPHAPLFPHTTNILTSPCHPNSSVLPMPPALHLRACIPARTP